jgi:hypothetical protein
LTLAHSYYSFLLPRCHEVSNSGPMYALHHDVLFHIRPRNNGDKWPCTQISGTVSQNKSFLLLSFSLRCLPWQQKARLTQNIFGYVYSSLLNISTLWKSLLMWPRSCLIQGQIIWNKHKLDKNKVSKLK